MSRDIRPVDEREGAEQLLVALLPHQPPGRDDQVVIRLLENRAEEIEVDAGRGDDDALLGGALEQQRRLRLSVVQRKRSVCSRIGRLYGRSEVPVGVEEGSVSQTVSTSL